MRYAAITNRLDGLGGEKWAVHALARKMAAEGKQIIELTIGEPDVPTPVSLIEAASAAMAAGRTGYSNGRGEPALTRALAARYSMRRGRAIEAEQVICLPGTQTTLFAVLMTLLGPGDEVLVGDPMYATYAGLIAATGATMVPVPLLAEHGFRMQAADLAARVTPRSRVIFLNSPHNPTGAVLSRAEIAGLGDVAVAHDLWIVCDEVYEEMVFDGTQFASPLDDPALADRVVVASSISKSHAAPGFRSGWCVGPTDFCNRLLSLSETMLFGSQPFIADMTALAVSAPSAVAAAMAERFKRRAGLIVDLLDGQSGLRVNRPDAGMFALVDIGVTGATGDVFAMRLLEDQNVAVMPGESFGAALAGWVRVSLTQDDTLIAEACMRILRQVAALQEQAA